MSASARDAEARKALTQPLITPQAVGDIEAQQLVVPATVIDVQTQPLIPATQPPPAPVPATQPPPASVPTPQPPPAPVPASQPLPASVPTPQPPPAPVPATQPSAAPVPATQPPPAPASGTQPRPQPAPGLLQAQPQPPPVAEQPQITEATGGQGKIPAGQLLVNQTFRSTAHLANYLPTGTMLVFQLLSPVFTNLGMCDVVFQTCTAVFLALCAFSCIIFTFTDSFIDSQGMVRYGFATFNGLWVVDGTPPPRDVAKYRITFIDIVHALMTASIFIAVAVIDPRVLLCLYPDASSYETLLLKLVPIFVAVVCSALFIIFPTDRHGIGFPIAPY